MFSGSTTSYTINVNSGNEYWDVLFNYDTDVIDVYPANGKNGSFIVTWLDPTDCADYPNSVTITVQLRECNSLQRKIKIDLPPCNQ